MKPTHFKCKLFLADGTTALVGPIAREKDIVEETKDYFLAKGTYSGIEIDDVVIVPVTVTGNDNFRANK
jgi:hypothetical protein